MSIKENKNNLDFIKELVHLLKTNNLSNLELEQRSKQSDTLVIKISQSIDKASSTETISSVSDPKTSINTSFNQDGIIHKNIVEEKTNKNQNDDPLIHPGILNSPMVGTVYLAPEPGADPFVKIGDTVKVGQTILIVEAMKTLNQIPASKSGVIKTIFVEDGSPVEFGSPLAIIE